MPLRGKVTTGGEVLRELYEISARYQVMGRPDHPDSRPGRVHNSGSLWVWLETAYARINAIGDDDTVTADQMRTALLDLATMAVAWSREIREDSS